MQRSLASALLLCCSIFTPYPAASAQPVTSAEYKAAVAAYERGDFNSAVNAFSALDKAGDLQARGALSLMYLQGRGVSKSTEIAGRLSESAALEGVVIAQFVQGLLNSEESTAPNYREAIRWFSLAAEQGHAGAQANLGTIHLAGWGGRQDIRLGMFWTLKAAEQGIPTAQENMGKVYLEGVGTQIDYKKSAYWYAKAARQGSAQALNSLGLMYVQGTGFAENKVNAYAYFDMAGKRGSESARMNQARLQPQLTASELRHALKLSSNWKPGDSLPGE